MIWESIRSIHWGSLVSWYLIESSGLKDLRESMINAGVFDKVLCRQFSNYSAIVNRRLDLCWK